MMRSAWLACLEVLIVSRVAVVVVADVAPIRDLAAYNAGLFGSAPNQTFHSTDIVAPVFGVSTWNADQLAAHSLPFLFFTGSQPNSSPTPFIFNSTDLSLVWAAEGAHLPGAMNFQPQAYKGEDYLTLWEGYKTGGYGTGKCMLYDRTYQQVHEISSVDIGVGADIHECKLTDDDTALITIYKNAPWDLRPVGGKENDELLDCFFQEIDVETGELVFSWRASDHFTIEDSYKDYSAPYDFFHLNSISKTPEGDFLISSRHLHALALIAGKDSPGAGSPIWILNGKRNQFTDLSGGAALDFSWQHHARFHDRAGTDLTLFDNHAADVFAGYTGCKENCSRAMHLNLDPWDKTVKLAAAYPHPQGLVSGTMGSVQALLSYGVPDGNVIVGWGANPAVTEYSVLDGSCVMDVQIGPYAPAFDSTTAPTTYRAFKGNWVGIPTTNPDIAGDWITQTVYVSWNGATEVRSWAVYTADDDPTSLSYLKTVAKNGFEMAISVPQHVYVRVWALDGSGKALGLTSTVNYQFNMPVA